MKPFEYERATGSAAAVATVGADPERVRYLGGGTNLVDLMKQGVEAPDRLVDVSRLPHRQIVQLADGGVQVGAAVTNAELAADPKIRTRYPLLAQAILAGASGQLRNLATTGGNLMQRTRCAYFADVTKPCNKREPGTGCPAIEGEHRNHAILGHSPACIATHPSDMAVALTAIGASVHVEGTNGPRTIPMPGFHRLPGETPEHDTVLDAGDLITAVELPPLPLAANGRYRKVRDRASFAFAVVSIAAAIETEADGTVREVRIALGGVAHIPWRATRAEEVLRGAPANEASFAAAAEAELAQAEPLRENAFKVPLARNLIVRTLLDLTDNDGGHGA